VSQMVMKTGYQPRINKQLPNVNHWHERGNLWRCK